jgi:hypothetical protein
MDMWEDETKDIFHLVAAGECGGDEWKSMMHRGEHYRDALLAIEAETTDAHTKKEARRALGKVQG